MSTDTAEFNRVVGTMIGDSWDRIQLAGDNVALRFYTILFRAHHDLRAKFPPHMREQREKISLMVDVIVKTFKDNGGQIPTVLHLELQELGRQHHSQFGVLDEHYPMVCGALIATFKYYDARFWDEDMTMYWQHALHAVSEIMMSGAK